MKSSITNRRTFLTAALTVPAVSFPSRVQAAAGPGALQDPQDRMKGAPIGDGERFVPVQGKLFSTPYDNDQFIIGVERKVRCTCGCMLSVYQCRTSDPECSFWPGHHATIVEQATAGMTAEEIIQAYVAKNGEEFLMAPVAQGFNLLAYVLPGTLILVTGALLALFLRREQRVVAVAAVASGPGLDGDAGLSDDERKLLEAELQDLET
ncbi:MAG: cytochrome c-type biogenesis protein CcmH [Gemmatimonadetes bacterium]|nr:cytochrome c-type biogenesis protein CcmH [Gemmatimonadota bacterium]MCH8255766.1 cytochrome c-type biogenesis protein CcmH [Gemmatimonadota bacterium]